MTLFLEALSHEYRAAAACVDYLSMIFCQARVRTTRVVVRVIVHAGGVDLSRIFSASKPH